MSPGVPERSLAEVYATHPLREDTILARVARQRGTLEGIDELDLAVDSLTELTDQNHVGGVAAVVQLAAAAGVGASSRVLDVGSGLGGSARLLAHLFGCRIHGIELTSDRCLQAERLTARVGLSRLVTFTAGDVLAADLPAGGFDVVWGQSAWMHVADTRALASRCAASLAAGGRVAFEDSYRMRMPDSGSEAAMFRELEQLWGGRILSRAEWCAPFKRESLEIARFEDCTAGFVRYLGRLLQIAQGAGDGWYPRHEVRAFAHGVALASAGVIGYARFVTGPRAEGG